MAKASASTGDDNSGVLSCWKTSCNMLKDVGTCNVLQLHDSWTTESEAKLVLEWASCEKLCFLISEPDWLKKLQPWLRLSSLMNFRSFFMLNNWYVALLPNWSLMHLDARSVCFKLSSSELCLLQVELAAWCHSIETSLAVRKGGKNGNDDVWFGMANRCKWSLICETYKKNDA